MHNFCHHCYKVHLFGLDCFHCFTSGSSCYDRRASCTSPVWFAVQCNHHKVNIQSWTDICSLALTSSSVGIIMMLLPCFRHDSCCLNDMLQDVSGSFSHSTAGSGRSSPKSARYSCSSLTGAFVYRAYASRHSLHNALSPMKSSMTVCSVQLRDRLFVTAV